MAIYEQVLPIARAQADVPTLPGFGAHHSNVGVVVLRRTLLLEGMWRVRPAAPWIELQASHVSHEYRMHAVEFKPKQLSFNPSANLARCPAGCTVRMHQRHTEGPIAWRRYT